MAYEIILSTKIAVELYYNIIKKQLSNFISKHLNVKMGVLSGIVTGSIVFAINISFGFWPALVSFLNQFAFNFFVAGYNTKLCEKIAKNINYKLLALLSASIIPTLLAFVILYSIHFFGGTPRPMDSTLWQVVFNLIYFFFMALIFRDIIHIKRPSF